MLAGAAFMGWTKGVAWEQAKQAKRNLAAQMAEVGAANEIARVERERLKTEAERDLLAKQLEGAAYAQPVNDNCGIDADRVRRLKLR